MSIKLETSVTDTPDFGGFSFFVECGDDFDLSDYCEAYGLRPDDIAEDGFGGWKAVQDYAAQLSPGQWLEVSHEAACYAAAMEEE